MNFSRFEKPSRYINSEINAIYKNAEVKVALAFPDIYDIGMSHLGLRILYKIINDISYASAERVFSPWLDMEEEMKAKGIPLTSLETKRPVKDFDIVGFSLQYELSYTTVLNMLSMSGIPIRSDDRGERQPLIIAGGPCAVNPLPMSPFIDAFLIGDGEDAIKDILDSFHSWKTGGDGKKYSLLSSLSEIEGVYIPLIHGTRFDNKGYRVKRRYKESLDDAPYPTAPIVPFTSIVHDRINIEVSRGCTMGCRFCQAGMIYRPLRERSPEKILQIAKNSFRNTGYEDISLTSLSAGDYSFLLPLIKRINEMFSQKTVSLSLPSLRVAAVNRDVLREIKSVRKTGFTIAPEAATERLRAVINKDFSDEDYDNALNALFAEGWENLKLYFMVGLPTEGDEDIEAIPEMAQKAIRIGKKYSRRHINVNVGVSPFVPKPFTPFQWGGQEDMEKIKEKLAYLRQRLSRKGMNFKGHNPNMSLLEAVFARGDYRLPELIEKAWSLGARLDAWTEAFDFNKWLEAGEKTGIDIRNYAERSFEKDDPLPWDIIDLGVRKEFLWREYQTALACKITPDCKKICSGCGLACKTDAEKRGNGDGEKLKIVGAGPCVCPHPASITRQAPLPALRVRVEFSKTGDLRYLSHRELMTAIMRAVRRADIPVLFSQGFHPAPKLSFGPPLNVGVGGLKEYFDMEIRPGYRITDLTDALNNRLPDGLRINAFSPIPVNEPSLQSFVSRYEYEIICPDAGMIKEFLERSDFFINREKSHKNGNSPVDIRKMVEDGTIIDDGTVRLIVGDGGEEKVRLGELMTAVFLVPAEDLEITRLDMFGWRDEWVSPLYFSEKKDSSERICIAS